MEVLVNGILIDCDFEKWEFEGKKGIRHYCTIKTVEKKLITFKIEEQDFNLYSDLVGQDISVICKIFVRGTYSLKSIGLN